MEQYDALVQILALTLGVGWASGINLYAAVLMLGLLGATGQMALPEELAVLASPLVIATAALMYCVEFFADKLPGVDTAWDAIHSFIRIPAGALLAAGAVGEIGLAAQLSAGLVGGGLATASHAAKAGSRVAINSSPEPFSNWVASLGEDALVFAGLWTALNYPWLFLLLLLVFIGLMIWLLPRLWRLIRNAFGFLRRLFGPSSESDAQSKPDKSAAAKSSAAKSSAAKSVAGKARAAKSAAGEPSAGKRPAGKGKRKPRRQKSMA